MRLRAHLARGVADGTRRAAHERDGHVPASLKPGEDDDPEKVALRSQVERANDGMVWYELNNGVFVRQPSPMLAHTFRTGGSVKRGF